MAAFSGFFPALSGPLSPVVIRQCFGDDFGKADLPRHGLAVALLVLREGLPALLGDAVPVPVVDRAGGLDP